MRIIRQILLLVACVVGLPAALARASPEGELHFEKHVRPVLIQKCFKCHGGEKTSNGLRVDSRESLLKGGDQGAAIVPGKARESLLYRALDPNDDELEMPPKNPLSAHEVAAFATWINDGAVWPKHGDTRDAFQPVRHWAFVRVDAPQVPPNPTGWSDHPVDRFIAAERAKHGLKPVAVAEPRALIRRATYDLTGLPPTPEEIFAFLAARENDRTAAWEKLVERLLASPRYGEHWARHWLDLARYADTAGDAADYPVREARLYRDYVIDALNKDKPYDEFVVEQLAGDLLARDLESDETRYAECTIATGFLALSRRFGGQRADYDDMHLTIEDTIDTVGRTFLGLTLQCARCHDHKFDPITNRDYYALYGIFQSTRYPYPGSEFFATSVQAGIIDDAQFVMDIATIRGFPPTIPPSQSMPRIAAHQKRIRDLEQLIAWDGVPDATANSRKFTLLGRIGALTAERKAQAGALAKLKPTDPKHLETKTRLERLDRQIAAARELIQLRREELPLGMPRSYSVSDVAAVADARIQLQGDPHSLGEVVHRDAPAFLRGERTLQIPPGQSGRLQLARWIASPDHPLTARVMVNRIWQHHFGKGIVETPSNFGLRGEAPTHAALLDWLAEQFVRSGWSIKAMHRLIMSSQTYQLSASGNPNNAALDPENHGYWRFDRRRLSAEEIRDALLYVGGSLDMHRPGPHPFPRIEDWKWSQHGPFRAAYDHRHRSIFLMAQRSQRNAYLALFDAAPNDRSTPARRESIVPTQSLFLLNSPLVSEQAKNLAVRLTRETVSEAGRIQAAHRLAWGRDPNPAELAAAGQYLEDYRRRLAASRIAAAEQELRLWSSFAQLLLISNEFLYLD